jgi:hypothetical protein
MISMTEVKMVNRGIKDRETSLEIKKLCSVVQCSKIVEGVEDRSVSQLLLGSQENHSVVKEVGVVSCNCMLFNAFFIYKTLNKNWKTKYKTFLPELPKALDIHNKESNCVQL